MKDSLYRINGVALPQPDGDVKMEFENRCSPDSGLDESGFYHCITERSGVASWQFRYGQLTRQAFDVLAELLPHWGSFTFTYPREGGTFTCPAYITDYQVQKTTDGDLRLLTFTVKQC